MNSPLRNKAAPVQPFKTTYTDSLTHFLEESICTHTCVIFNPQLTSLCHMVIGPSYRFESYKSCTCLAVSLLPLYLEGQVWHIQSGTLVVVS